MLEKLGDHLPEFAVMRALEFMHSKQLVGKMLRKARSEHKVPCFRLKYNQVALHKFKISGMKRAFDVGSLTEEDTVDPLLWLRTQWSELCNAVHCLSLFWHCQVVQLSSPSN